MPGQWEEASFVLLQVWQVQVCLSVRSTPVCAAITGHFPSHTLIPVSSDHFSLC